jgi:hypothetical protein
LYDAAHNHATGFCALRKIFSLTMYDPAEQAWALCRREKVPEKLVFVQRSNRLKYGQFKMLMQI